MRARSTLARPTPQRLPPTLSLFAALLLFASTSHSSTQTAQWYLTCKHSNSLLCFTWDVKSKEVDVWNRLPTNSPLRRYCRIRPLISKEDKHETVDIHTLLSTETIWKTLSCKRMKSAEEFNWQNVQKTIGSLRRIRRQSGYSPRGRYRGQTQSQYLSIDHGNGKDEGKAEAHSSADTSRASVSGKSGMGQAQSQTIYDPSCEECYGKPELGPASLQQRPISSSTGGDPHSQGSGSEGYVPGQGGRPSETSGSAYPSSQTTHLTGTNGGYGRGKPPLGGPEGFSYPSQTGVSVGLSPSQGSESGRRPYPTGQSGGSESLRPNQGGSPSGTGGITYPSLTNGFHHLGQIGGPSGTGGVQYPSGQPGLSGSYNPSQGGTVANQYPSVHPALSASYNPSPGGTLANQYPGVQPGVSGGYNPSQGGTVVNQHPNGRNGAYSPGQSGGPSVTVGNQYPTGQNGNGPSQSRTPAETDGSQYPSGDITGYHPGQETSGTQYPNGQGGNYSPGSGNALTGTSGSQYPTALGSGPSGTNSIQFPNSGAVYRPGQGSGTSGILYPSVQNGGNQGNTLDSGGGSIYPNGQVWGSGSYSPVQVRVPGSAAGSQYPNSQTGGDTRYVPSQGGGKSEIGINRYPNDQTGISHSYIPGKGSGGGGTGVQYPIQGSDMVGSLGNPIVGPGTALQSGISGTGDYGSPQTGGTGGSGIPVQGGPSRSSYFRPIEGQNGYNPVQRNPVINTGVISSKNLRPSVTGGYTAIPGGPTYYCCVLGPNGQPQYVSGVSDHSYGVPANIGATINTQPNIYGRNPSQIYGTENQTPLQNFGRPTQNGIQGSNGNEGYEGYGVDKSSGSVPNVGSVPGADRGYESYSNGNPNIINSGQPLSNGNGKPYYGTGDSVQQSSLQPAITAPNGLPAGPYSSGVSTPVAGTHYQVPTYENIGMQQNLPQNNQYGPGAVPEGNTGLPPQNGPLVNNIHSELQTPSRDGHVLNTNGQFIDGGAGQQPSGEYHGGLYGQDPNINEPRIQYPSYPHGIGNINVPGGSRYGSDRFGGTGQPQSIDPAMGTSNGLYGQDGHINAITPGLAGEYSGVPQNFIDPNAIVTSQDLDDSEAVATVSQNSNGTLASASSKGGNDKGRAQTQVEGTYTGSGSFSAQAQISDDTKRAESQVSGGKHGASSNALGGGRNNTSQADVQLGSETGSLQTHAQSEGSMHSSNSQVQGSLKGGMADAQAKGPGSTSSQAQIGFTPYNEKDKSHDLLQTPFVGQGTASAQSSGRTGQSQSQLEGAFKYGIKYNGAAQSGASLDKDAVFVNRLTFNKIDVFDETNKVIDVDAEESEQSLSTETTTIAIVETEPPATVTPLSDIPFDTSVVTEKVNEEAMKNSESRYSGHAHSDHHKSDGKSYISGGQTPGQRSFQDGYSANGADYEYTTDKDENPPDDYDPEVGFGTDGTEPAEVEQAEYGNYDEYSRDSEPTHQSLSKLGKKDLVIKQNTRGNSQHIVLGSLRDQDAIITQRNSEQRPDERRIYQPGERVPGTGGYTIPIGFTGSVKSVASKDGTYVVGSRDSPSQAQTVSLKPGSGKIKYTYPKYGESVNPKDLRSLSHPKADRDRYVSVSKSVTGALDGENNIRKQYSHTYYTKSSSCGYFTFTCTMVSGTNGRKKVCKPKIPTNSDGTPMRC